MEGKRLLKLLRRSLTRSNTMFNSRYRPSESCFGLDLRTQVSHDILYTFSTRCTDTLQRRPCILPGCPSLLVLRGWGFSRPTLPNGPQHDPRWPRAFLGTSSGRAFEQGATTALSPGSSRLSLPKRLSKLTSVRRPLPPARNSPGMAFLRNAQEQTLYFQSLAQEEGEGWWATSPL